MKIDNNSPLSSSDQIESFYASEILSGRLTVGTRLPSNETLAKKWSASVRTIHKALANLVAQGLLERKQRRGTYVRDQSHNSVIGVLVGANLVNTPAHYSRWLCYEIEKAIENSGFACRVYDNLLEESALDPQKFRSIRHFFLDRSLHNFKGYIYIGTGTIKSVRGLEDLKPRVTHQDESRGLDVLIDMDHFVKTTISELASRGLERMAYLRPLWPGWKKEEKQEPDNINEILTQCGEELNIPKPRLINLDLVSESQAMVSEAYELLVRMLKGHGLGKGSKFPEVIIIPDDILMQSLIAALHTVGLKVPEDVAIATLSNAEIDHFYGVLVYRYEISLKNTAKELVSLLKLRMGKVPEPPLPISIKGKFLELK